jgi:hypothetical protein
MDVWLQCLLSGLAVWRLTHLLSNEDGPWGVFERLRLAAGRGFWGELLHCFYCLSVWVSLPFAVLLPCAWWHRFLALWAFSAMACLLERATRDALEIKLEP